MEEHFTHHIVNDFLEASKILTDHEIANTLRYSVYQVTKKFGETGKFEKIYIISNYSLTVYRTFRTYTRTDIAMLIVQLDY